jgi:hypothetical protein
MEDRVFLTGSAGHRSRVFGVHGCIGLLGSPLPTETTGERPPTAENRAAGVDPWRIGLPWVTGSPVLSPLRLPLSLISRSHLSDSRSQLPLNLSLYLSSRGLSVTLNLSASFEPEEQKEEDKEKEVKRK